ncbi:alpha/beta hydrolase family protein [Micromonospora sp. NBS 11-29]|uniref:alpha/beta hydrolase family protein n=1 Tax=Micromonospora sp. NBS 11-29 TaxID=1960879 RepID=UPI000B7989E9|nr:alpha/beta hydrolase [Micromonospora sp. NBS 11-29]
MTGQRLVAALMTALVTALLAGCGAAMATTGPAPADVRTAPERPYPVGVRQLTVDLNGPRPLPVTVWYPADPPASPGRTTGAFARPAPAPTGRYLRSFTATSLAGSAVGPSRPMGPAGPPNSGAQAGPSVRVRAPMAAGRFPVVLYSHGLRSLPALHAQLTTRWAAAGFVVVAPTYPRTNLRARNFTRDDVRNQPADARRLIRHLVRLSARPGDPLGAHLAVNRIAAAGHSAGGHTTLGMFASGRPSPLRAGIVIAGGRLVDGPSRPLAPMLFVHGTADRIVPESVGRAAYARCLGPAAFLSLPGQGHGEYLNPSRPGFPQVLDTTTDFLRWALYADRAALGRLPADATSPGTTTFTTRALPT